VPVSTDTDSLVVSLLAAITGGKHADNLLKAERYELSVVHNYD